MTTISIYKLPKKGIIIYGTSPEEGGLRIATGPFIKIPNDDITDQSLLSAIKECLSNTSDKTVPRPKDWKESNNIFL